MMIPTLVKINPAAMKGLTAKRACLLTLEEGIQRSEHQEEDANCTEGNQELNGDVLLSAERVVNRRVIRLCRRERIGDARRLSPVPQPDRAVGARAESRHEGVELQLPRAFRRLARGHDERFHLRIHYGGDDPFERSVQDQGRQEERIERAHMRITPENHGKSNYRTEDADHVEGGFDNEGGSVETQAAAEGPRVRLERRDLGRNGLGGEGEGNDLRKNKEQQQAADPGRPFQEVKLFSVHWSHRATPP